MFARMRMDPSDISDVTAAAYTLLVNGHSPGENWTGLFRPGERVRLRIINAAAQTTFNFRIPGLPMTVVATDGINVRPVEVDEFQIGNAETYDFIVEPQDQAYTIVAETHRPSGMARATLAPRLGMAAAGAAAARAAALLDAWRDMGHGHGMRPCGHGPRLGRARRSAGDGPWQHGHARQVEGRLPGRGRRRHDRARCRWTAPAIPGIGLENVGHRVLTYRDLVSLDPEHATRGRRPGASTST